MADMTDKEKKYRTVNNVLGITDDREKEICKKIDEIQDVMFAKTGGNIAGMIQEIEKCDSFNRIEKSYAIFMMGEAVGRSRDRDKEWI